MAYCTKCGKPTTNGQAFCESCSGARSAVPSGSCPVDPVRTQERESKDKKILFVCLIFAIISFALVIIAGIMDMTTIGKLTSLLSTYNNVSTMNEDEVAGLILAMMGAVCVFIFALISAVIGILVIVFNSKITNKNSMQKAQRRKEAITWFVFVAIFVVLVLLAFIFQLYAFFGSFAYSVVISGEASAEMQPFAQTHLVGMLLTDVAFLLSIAMLIMSLIYMLRSCIKKMPD